jgi:hypothetical protein
MGVTTYWFGSVAVEPKLGTRESDLLDQLSEGEDLIPAPDLGRCGWIALPDRQHLVWDRGEKFNDGAEWLRILLGGELAGFRANGTVLGFCSPESDLVDAIRITVTDSDVSVRIYDIPMLDDDAVIEDEEVWIDDALYAISGLDGAEPDYHEASETLDRYLSVVPLSALGELDTFLTDLLDLLGRPEPLNTTFQSHRR